MNKEAAIKIFEQKQIRTHWDDEQEKWYFSIVDVVGVLSESIDPQAYWRKLKQRLKEEGNETVTNCHALKMIAADGKMRQTDVAHTRQGGTIAGNTRREIEAKTGKKVVTSQNARQLDKNKDKELGGS